MRGYRWADLPVSLGVAPERTSRLQCRVGSQERLSSRGRPVALLSPLPAADPLAQLEASGDLVRGRQRLDDLPPPVPLEPGSDPPSKVLERLRRDER